MPVNGDRMVRALQYLAREFCPSIAEFRRAMAPNADSLLDGMTAKGLAEYQADTVRLTEAGQRWALEQENLA